MKTLVTRHNKPRSVMVAVWLIYSAAFLAGAVIPYDMVTGTDYNSLAPIEYLPDTLLLVVIAVLAYFIASGRRLARLIYIVLALVIHALLFVAFSLTGGVSYNETLVLIQIFMQLLALVLLITPSANAWFKRENIKTTEPHDGKPI